MTHGTAAGPPLDPPVDPSLEPPAAPPTRPRGRLSAFLRDERVIQFLVQLLFVAAVLWIGLLLYQNMAYALAKQGLQLGFGFLNQVSGFDISIKFLSHTRTSSNLTAIQVGLINTLVASILSIVFSTILGVIVGVMRISNNYLVNRAAWLYIEIFRNIPLLLVIIVSYAVIIYNLPDVKQAIVLPGPSYLSNRGLLPAAAPNHCHDHGLRGAAGSLSGARRGAGEAAHAPLPAGQLHRHADRPRHPARPGDRRPGLLSRVPPFVLDVPQKTGLNYTGGVGFPPEFVAIVVGLTLGSAPFTADTVRAGLQSVTTEQIRAAHALGLSGYLTLRLVIFPQAMRVIVPPMTSNLPQPDQEFVAGLRHRLSRGRAHFQHHHQPDGPRRRDDGCADGDLCDAQPADFALHELV